MFKKGKCLILLFVIIFMIGAVSAEDLSENQVAAVDGSTFDEAQLYIDMMDDNVMLTDSYYYAATENQPITINKNVTILAFEQATFDGKGITQIFSIGKNCKVTFMQVSFINGKGIDGGAIFVDTNSSVEFLNVELVNNDAVNGGAIYVSQYSNVSLLNVNMTDNVAANSGGAIFVDYNVTAQVLTAKFSNNSADNGGAIFSNGKVTLLYSSLETNKALNYGGAMFCGNKSEILPLYDNFTGNIATDGGAIYVGEYSNVAIGVCNFTDNIATNSGGALFAASNSNSTALFSEFKHNAANLGGAISCDGQDGDFIAIVCNFTDNYANNGGALYVNKGLLGATTSNFENNLANRGGAVFAESDARLHLMHNNFTEEGDQVYILSSTLNLFNNSLKDNKSAIVIFNTSLENKTYLVADDIKTAPFSTVNITIGLYDDNMNPIEVLDGINATVGDKKVNVLFNNKTNDYAFEFKTAGIGNYTISADIPKFKELDEKNGVLEVYYNTILNVTANDGIFGNNITISAKINTKGNLTFKVNNKNYIVPIVNGEANLTLSNLSAGRYDVSVVFNGTENYSGAAINCNFSVYNSINIFAENVVMYYMNGTKLNAQVLDYKGAPIVGAVVDIIANGELYNRTTNNEGWIAFNIRLGVGNYTFKLNYKEASVNVSVEVKSTIVSSNLVKMFHNQSNYEAQFLDENGNPLVGHKVTFNINGVFYNRTTNYEGKAKLTINLSPNTYILTAINFNNGEMASYKVTVVSLIQADNLVKFYNNGSQYLIKTYDDQGKIAPWQTVCININGMFYWKTSNVLGIAKLSINLNPGKYIATVEFRNCYISNDITVLPTIESKNIEMTMSDRVPFVAKVLDGQGKPVSGVKLTFNINGMLYERTSNSEGSASLGINLMPGQYVITTMTENCTVSNTVTVLP